MVMTPFDNCFSAGMCLRIEMRYMPTGGVFAGISPECDMLLVITLLLSMKNRVGWVMSTLERVGKKSLRN